MTMVAVEVAVEKSTAEDVPASDAKLYQAHCEWTCKELRYFQKVWASYDPVADGEVARIASLKRELRDLLRLRAENDELRRQISELKRIIKAGSPTAEQQKQQQRMRALVTEKEGLLNNLREKDRKAIELRREMAAMVIQYKYKEAKRVEAVTAYVQRSAQRATRKEEEIRQRDDVIEHLELQVQSLQEELMASSRDHDKDKKDKEALMQQLRMTQVTNNCHVGKISRLEEELRALMKQVRTLEATNRGHVKVANWCRHGIWCDRYRNGTCGFDHSWHQQGGGGGGGGGGGAGGGGAGGGGFSTSRCRPVGGGV